jgi:ABC-type branched-subunit amino acid transport system ATPase component/branched-subunit amino acid ABC-type transport system permease component
LTEIWQFLLLGVALAPAYILLGHSTVLVFRGSNVVNFAVGTYALIGASVFYAASHAGIPLAPALALGLIGGGVIGAATYLIVIRNLRSASQLVKVVATLGVQIVILEALALHFKDSVLFPPTLLPNRQWHILGAAVGSYNLCLFGLTALLTVGLWGLYRYTLFGLQTSAVAENRRAAAALGRSPETIGLVNWILGGVLAAFAGIVITPTLGLSVGGISLLLVPALAVALLASFRNFWLVVLGGLVVGVGESELTHFISKYSWGFGWPQAFPFIVIVIVLVLRGTSLPDRSFVANKLPAIGTGRAPLSIIISSILVVVVGLILLSGAGAAALAVSLGGGVILLSIVSVTGYAGQVSLAQVAIGSLGAFIAARLGHALDLSFWLSLLVGIIAILPIGALIGLPALRARGVNLAIVTLGLAMVIDTVILGNTNYTGGYIGLPIAPPSLFGLSLDSTAHPNRYAAMCLVFFILAGWVVSNLRRGRVGRHLIAVRANERAAVALGLNLTTVKLYAFVVASALAALGGILIAFQSDTVLFGSVSPTDSITYLSFIVIAGLGYVSGVPFASMLLAGGFFTWVLGTIFTGSSTATYLALAGGVGTILILLADPDGVTSLNIKTAKADFSQMPRWAYFRPEVIVLVIFAQMRKRFARPTAGSGQTSASSVPPSGHVVRVEPGTLVLEDVTVRFGGVTALNEVSLRVEPGEIVALIGPNGAGKTTLVDAVTGMVPRYDGRILLNERPLEGLSASQRARAGLGRSFQSLELFEDLSVVDNLRAASDRPRARHYLTDLVAPRSPALPAAVVTAINEFGLGPDLARKPADLAFGRRRLVGIARAVAYMPRVLLLDEPASGLDESESKELATLLRRLADEWGFAILLIEHDMSVVLSISDRVVALDFGKKIAEGSAQQIRSDPAVIGAYLGVEGDPPSDQRELEATR